MLLPTLLNNPIPRPLPFLHQNPPLPIHWHAPQKRHLKTPRHGLPAPLAKQVGPLPTALAHVPAHILHHAQNVHPDRPAKIDLLPHVADRHSLRRRDDDGAGELAGDGFRLQRFGEGDVLVRGAGRGVDEEVVGWRPEDVGEELPDHGRLLGAAPNDGGGARGEEEGEGYGVQGSYRFLIILACARCGLWRWWAGFRGPVCIGFFGRWCWRGIAILRLQLSG